MNPIAFIHKEFHAAWDEVNRPLFSESSENDEFYDELFNYYHALPGKTIDTSRGESLFPAITDNVYPVRRQHLHIIKAELSSLSAQTKLMPFGYKEKLSEISAPAGFDEKNWKIA
ncbi:hypothetical protein [Candidatus Methylobacter oryzae]|uniref:Uncharacterized protein n=1 Tax=Candidatus Methylobacter oryzae TaxID=2497749 RepID=A0ABY3CDA0_9GAMM|nr:hypothetical protein [Candidatus Methylobacter oryzae]TRW94561.1 hypothetical protein EKO24_011615 [Candidatus Methylobacter oryzae]